MPVLKDEMVFQADGFIPVDPAIGLRESAQSFIRSRPWSTLSIFYGDQQESDDPHAEPGWSMTFGLGLDHASRTTADWFSDVAAIVEFLQPIASETQSEFTLEFRLSSRLWYSETLGHISGEPGDKVDIAAVRTMLQQLTKQRRSWWQRLIGK